jgi:two-component system, response regulator PdtaR
MIPAFFDGMPRADAAIRVLLAEDEFLLRLDAAESIRRLGWEIVEVSSADEAIELLGHSVRFDLLLTDIHMPGRSDGLDLARYVRKHHPEMKIAIMSGSGEASLSDAGSYDLFLRKPIWNVGDDLVALMKGVRHAG